MYGTTLRLPGEFFVQNQGSHAQPSVADMTYVSRLKETMHSLAAIPPRQPSGRRMHVSEALSNCSHIFVRFNAVKKPLQQPYNGPYRVLSRSAKQYYTIDYNGHPTVISLDRLKAAHIDLPSTNTTDMSPLPSAPPPPQQRVTRSGCHVHWPKRLVHYI